MDGERYLLDTCAAIWINERSLLSGMATDIVRAAEAGKHKLAVSPITAWEMGMLVAKGRYLMSSSPHAWFRQLCGARGVELTECDPDILIDSSSLPGNLGSADPADRIIVSTARAAGFTIMTRDEPMLDYARQGHVRALRC